MKFRFNLGEVEVKKGLTEVKIGNFDVEVEMSLEEMKESGSQISELIKEMKNELKNFELKKEF